jgi:hypothetical protein
LVRLHVRAAAHDDQPEVGVLASALHGVACDPRAAPGPQVVVDVPEVVRARRRGAGSGRPTPWRLCCCRGTCR